MAKQQRKYKIKMANVYGQIVDIDPPFSIDFDVEKAIFSNVCNCSITIYNLGATTRQELYKDLKQYSTEEQIGKRYRTIEFYLGYENQILSKVFSGVVTQCYSHRIGTDFLTVIEATSGSVFLADNFISTTAPEGQSVEDALIQWVSGVNPDQPLQTAIGTFNKVFKRETSIVGPIDKLIKEYTSGHFFLDDNVVFCANDSDYIDGVLNVVDASTGLLGSPRKEETRIVFDIILEPRLLVYQKINLISQTVDFFNGVFKVVGLHHVGTISEASCGVAKTKVTVIFGSGFVNTKMVIK